MTTFEIHFDNAEPFILRNPVAHLSELLDGMSQQWPNDKNIVVPIPNVWRSLGFSRADVVDMFAELVDAWSTFDAERRRSTSNINAVAFFMCWHRPTLGSPIDSAMAIGNERALEYAHKVAGFEWTPSSMKLAAKANNVSCMQYAFENGCPVDANCAYTAAMNGKYDALAWAREHGVRMTADIARVAAVNGHICCLQYAHENGAPIDGGLATLCAREREFRCAEFALEHGAIWTFKLTALVIKQFTGHDLLAYALGSGKHSVNVNYAAACAARYGNNAMLDLLLDYGADNFDEIALVAAENERFGLDVLASRGITFNVALPN